MKTDIKEIAAISIKYYLARIGIYPVKEKNSYGMYLCPFRADTTPSMKVDYVKNLWCDYGTGEGGSIIDLVMKLDQCTVKEAISKLKNGAYSDNSFSFHCEQPIQENSIELINVKAIQHPALIEYLQSRGIKEEAYQYYCKEVHYRVGDKQYFAVGFRNKSGGYELRSKFFKGCNKKDFSYIKNGSQVNRVLVFEGFMDFLSYLELGITSITGYDIIVLNSISLLPKAIPIIEKYYYIETYLDNDPAGETATNRILDHACIGIYDGRNEYSGYKDLNEYLIQTSQNNNQQNNTL